MIELIIKFDFLKEKESELNIGRDALEHQGIEMR